MSRSSKLKFIFLTKKAIDRNMCRLIPPFNIILTGQSPSEIILIIQGHLQDQKVNLRVK